MDQRIAMNPNRLVQYLQKPAAEFTRADIIRYCEENQIEFVNFHYCGWDEFDLVFLAITNDVSASEFRCRLLEVLHQTIGVHGNSLVHYDFVYLKI